MAARSSAFWSRSASPSAAIANTALLIIPIAAGKSELRLGSFSAIISSTAFLYEANNSPSGSPSDASAIKLAQTSAIAVAAFFCEKSGAGREIGEGAGVGSGVGTGVGVGCGVGSGELGVGVGMGVGSVSVLLLFPLQPPIFPTQTKTNKVIIVKNLIDLFIHIFISPDQK